MERLHPQRSFDGSTSEALVRHIGSSTAEIRTIDTDPDARSRLHHPDHCLLSALEGQAEEVRIDIEGARRFDGSKRTGAAGFAPAGRYTESIWPRGRIRYLLLMMPHNDIEARLEKDLVGDAWIASPDVSDPFVQSSLQELGRVLARPASPIDDLLAEAIVHALELSLIQRFSDYRLNEAGPKGPINEAIEYIDQHLGESLTLGDLTRLCALPKTRLTRAFVDHTGMTPHRFVLSRRLERARLLLTTTNLSIGEVALLVGCANGSHLSALFHDHFGMRPRAWRHQARRI